AYEDTTGATPEQEEMLQKAARYWRRVYENWGRDQTVSTGEPYREYEYYRYRGRWESTLGLKRPEGGGPIIIPRRPAGAR
ncbi:MAG: hypothetical protein AB1896_09650, partial [Thermodesulfobacteriota bacterium]